MANRVLCLVFVVALSLVGFSSGVVRSRFTARARSGIGSGSTSTSTSTPSTSASTTTSGPASTAVLTASTDECLPPVTFLIDRTGSMTADKTKVMIDTYTEFLKVSGITNFAWVRTPHRPKPSALTEDTEKAFSLATKPTLTISSIDVLGKRIMSVAPSGGKPGDGHGFTDLLTPLKIAAADAKSKPKLVILVTDELNNVYGGVSNGADYCKEWNQAVKDIEAGGGHFSLVFIPLKGQKSGTKGDKVPMDDYDVDPTAWLKFMKRDDKGDLDSFGKCYKEILSSPYVVKADKLQDSLNAVLQKVTLSVFFTSASDKLNDEDKAKIAKKIECCRGPARIACFTSKCGKEEFNKDLRRRRCQEVKNLHATKISDMSYIENKFKCPQDGAGDGCKEEDSPCAQVNRRVDITCPLISKTQVKK